MSESSAANKSGADKRRTTRVVRAMPIKVQGVDALSEPFTERTSTVMVSCHGCKYQSRHYAPKGSIVSLEIPRYDPNSPPRTVSGKVIWVQRPNQAREILHIGLEFETPGNVWDIPSAPRDWFPLPGEKMFAADRPDAMPGVATISSKARVETITWDESEIVAMAKPIEADAEAEIEVITATAEPEEEKAQPTFGTEIITADAEAVADGMRVIRQKLDAQFHDAIEEALTVSIERISESVLQRIVQQASERSAAIAEEARKAYEKDAEELDAKLDTKIQRAVEEALGKMPSDRHGKSKRRR